MVLPGLAQHRVQIPAPPNMPTTPKRSNRLHNFTLPSLRWGSQRYLRCANSSSAATTTEDDASATRDRRSPASVSDDSTASWMMEFNTERNARSSRIPKPPICGGNGDNDDGIDAVRKKLVLDLKTAAEKMKDEIWRKNVKQDEKEEEEEEEPEPSPPPPPPAMESKPWNLRTRRREEIKPPISSVSNGKKRKIEEKKPNSSSPVMTNGNCESNDGAGRLPRLRSNSEKTKQRKKFCVQLSKKEIEEDFEAMVGRRPPRRPIKRPKYVQKQMDVLFPGLWLTEVTADWYKVPESLQKVRKGKGKMHFSESDDEES